MQVDLFWKADMIIDIVLITQFQFKSTSYYIQYNDSSNKGKFLLQSITHFAFNPDSDLRVTESKQWEDKRAISKTELGNKKKTTLKHLAIILMFFFNHCLVRCIYD